MEEIRNAKIRSASIFIEDHGLLTAYVYLDYGDSVQGFGGYRLDRQMEHPSANDFGAFFVRRMLETVGVTEWDSLQGQPCRAKCENGLVIAIGHFINDKWFTPSELVKELGLK